MTNPNEVISNIVYVWRWMSRILQVFIILPATGFFMLTLFVGGWSFDGVARQFYEEAAELRVLNTNPLTFSVGVCADPKPDPKAPPLPRGPLCSQWTEQAQGIDQMAANAGHTLGGVYLFFVFIALVSMGLFGRLFPARPQVGVGAYHNQPKKEG